MLPRTDNLGARPLAYVEAPTPASASTDARQEVYHRLNQISLGQEVPAKVLERLQDGTFLVRVADASARMSLPVGAKVGDELSMTLVDRQPRPTFLLGVAGQAHDGDAPARLSSAARLIDSLLHSAQQNGGATALAGRVPMLPKPLADTAQVAAALHDTVDASGLFYESHLAQWATGSRSLTALLGEPQAAQGGAATSASGNTEAALLRHLASQWISNGQSIPELAAELQARTGNTTQPGLESQLNRLIQQLGNSQQSQAGGAAGELNPQVAQLIQAQLNALETQRFAWQGELWPGQKFAWEVERDAGHGKEQDQQEAWQSAVKFDLPHLGQVSATIHLTGERVSILVRTEAAASAALLRAHGGELALALDAAGSPLDALIVNDDNKT